MPLTSAAWLDAHFEADRPEYEAMFRSVGNDFLRGIGVVAEGVADRRAAANELSVGQDLSGHGPHSARI